MAKIFFSFIVLSFLIGAVGISAQDDSLALPGLTPDSPFYFMKAWKESIQIFFTFGAENKAKQYLHLADVRLAEYQKMVEKEKTEIAQKTLEKYEKQLNHALQKMEEIKDKKGEVKSFSETAEQAVTKHIDVLKSNLEKVPETAKKGLENAIENSTKIINEKIKKIKESSEEEVI